MAVTDGKKVKYESGTEPEFYGLLEQDGLRVAKGSTKLRVERCPNNDGNWVAWSNEDCEVNVKVTATLPSTPQKQIEIIIKATGDTFSHRGEVGGITGASWTAEEGP